jgi:hypothetical protein
MKKEKSNAGRKPIPDAVLLQVRVPKSQKQKVLDFIKTIQYINE